MNRTTQELFEALKTRQEIEKDGSWRTPQLAIASGQLIKIRNGIYYPANLWESLRPWEKQTVQALALTRKIPDAVLSHTSAAQLFGLVTPTDPCVHIYSSAQARGSVDGVKKHCLLTDDTPTVCFEFGVRATAPRLTVLDCARILPLKQAVALIDSALFTGTVSLSEIQQMLSHATGRNCRKMRLLATMISEKSESAGESYTRLLLDEMELTYTEQKEFWLAGRRYRCDFALEELGIIVEFDGKLKLTDFGASDAVLEQERYREKALQNAGWVVFRADWDLVVRRPAEFKRQLSQLIRRNTSFPPRYA